MKKKFSSSSPARQNSSLARQNKSRKAVSPPGRTGGRSPVSTNSGRASENKTKGPSWPRDWRAVIGHHAIMELLAVRPRSIQQAWMKQGWESSVELKELSQVLRAKGIHIDTVPATFLDKVSPSHQGAAIFSNHSLEVDWESLQNLEKAKVLVLDGIEDPQNLGAILRTAWLMNVKAVLTPEDRSVGLTATVHKVACGGVEHVPIERTTNFANPIEDLKKSGYWVFGLSHEGERSLFDLQIPEKVVWCIGSEEKGLRSTTERLCDELVRIPQISAAASYNASVATAIALTETYRQQMSKKV